MPDETYFKSENGEWERHYDCIFDRMRLFTCRRCGAIINHQLANHAILHKHVDEARYGNEMLA